MENNNLTIREWLNHACNENPIENVVEGIRISEVTTRDIFANPTFIGEELFLKTNKTFLTNPELLKYVDKQIVYFSTASGTGLDGEGHMSRWLGTHFYVLADEKRVLNKEEFE